MSKNWIGNSQFINACNSRNKDADEYDYYATSPHAVEKLLELESFSNHILGACMWRRTYI